VLPLLLALVTLQVTAVLVEPVTVAVNCSVPPKPTVELVGEIATVTFEAGGGVGVVPLLLLLPPPHPAATSARSKTTPIPALLAYFIGS